MTYAKQAPCIDFDFFLALIGPWIELTSANNTLSTATELYDGDIEDGYLCYPTCTSGYGPQDQYDWYKVYLQNGEMLHARLYNNGTPAQSIHRHDNFRLIIDEFDNPSELVTNYGIRTHTAHILDTIISLRLYLVWKR